jgi:hypothetical protein
MADRLAQDRPGGHLLRDLGLVVVLLEFCGQQRDQHGGLRAEVMRGDIAERTGLTVDRVDDCNRVLEHAGVLEINRRRAANGGRNLPSMYTIIEAGPPEIQGGVSETTAQRNGTARAEKTDTRRAAKRYSHRRTAGRGRLRFQPGPRAPRAGASLSCDRRGATLARRRTAARQASGAVRPS